MKVYFTCSTADLMRHRDSYWVTRDYIVGAGHVLTRDWLAEAEARLQSGRTELNDVRDIYRACVQAIREAELVIIDDTVSNFSTGHQITLALQLKKPTLVLWEGGKNHQFKRMFIHGIESDILEISAYTKDTLKSCIESFVNKYEANSERNRFHLVLSGAERRYLDWAQYIKGKSRTKVIREALHATMSEDADYETYLVGKAGK